MDEIAIKSTIEYGMVIVAATTVAFAAITKYFKYLETKLKETSVGATKIRELQDLDKKVLVDLEKLEHTCKTNHEEIMEVKKDQREFSNRVWDYMTKK